MCVESVLVISPGERLGLNTNCPAGYSGPALKLGLASATLKLVQCGVKERQCLVYIAVSWLRIVSIIN